MSILGNYVEFDISIFTSNFVMVSSVSQTYSADVTVVIVVVNVVVVVVNVGGRRNGITGTSSKAASSNFSSGQTPSSSSPSSSPGFSTLPPEVCDRISQPNRFVFVRCHILPTGSKHCFMFTKSRNI